MTAGALTGLRVLDLAHRVAGAYCTKLLAGLGAEVIKVERPVPSGPAARGHRSLSIHLNTGKKSIFLDLKQPASRGVFVKLVSGAGVVVESFAPGTMGRLGLDYPQLRAVNPGLVFTAISNFGQTGPYRDYQATEIVLQALGGFMALTGNPDREPVKLGGLQAQYQAGLQAALGTLAALQARHTTGTGQLVDVSILETVASLAVQNGAAAAYMRNEVPERTGNRLIGNVPTANYPSTTLPCKDGYTHVHGKGWDFEALSVLTQQPRLASEEIRLRQRGRADEIDALLTPWLMARTKMQVLKDAQEQFVPFCPVLNIDEVLGDPQHAARGYFVTIDDPTGGKVQVPGPPMRLQETPWTISPPPLAGQHTEEVLAGIGEELRKSEGEEVRGRAASFRDPPVHSAKKGGASPLPLQGIRVLDLTQVVAGPYATQVLADLGAEVIKIESHTRYDQIRGRARLASEPGARGYNRSSNFNTLNRNKLGLCLNLNTASGKAVFKQLVAISDVVIENFSPRVMRNFGLEYPVLRGLNPGVIVASMPGFGSDGPYQNFISLGPGIDAMSGLQSLTGYPDGPPLKSGGGYTDQTTGMNAVVAILAALQWRIRSGQGQRIEVAMREALTAMIGEFFVEYSLSGQLPARWGNRSPVFAPQGCYRCAGPDHWVVLSVRCDAEWQRLCTLIGEPGLTAEPRYQTLEGRKQRHDELDQILEAWTRRRTHLEAMAELQRAGLAAGAVLNPLELFADPHIAYRQYFEIGMHPEGGRTFYGHNGFRLERTPLRIRHPAPCFGEHTQSILKGLLGVPSDGIEQLYQDGVIADEPVS